MVLKCLRMLTKLNQETGRTLLSEILKVVHANSLHPSLPCRHILFFHLKENMDLPTGCRGEHWLEGRLEVKFINIYPETNNSINNLADGVTVSESVSPPIVSVKKKRNKMPATIREQFNMSYMLFKKMATTMSVLSAPDFQEKINLPLDIYEHIIKDKDIKLFVTGKPNGIKQQRMNNLCIFQ